MKNNKSTTTGQIKYFDSGNIMDIRTWIAAISYSVDLYYPSLIFYISSLIVQESLGNSIISGSLLIFAVGHMLASLFDLREKVEKNDRRKRK